MNFATQEEWHALLQEAGYSIVSKEVLQQEDYFAHLEELVELEGKRWPTKLFLKAVARAEVPA